MEDPIKLLSGEYEQSILSKIWNPVMGGIMGFGCMCFVNFGTKRPALSGIQRHIIATTIGVVGGRVVDHYRDQYHAERDAVLRHYVELHREDFPNRERKKWGQVLAPWVPIR